MRTPAALPAPDIFDLVERFQLRRVDTGSQPTPLDGDEPTRRDLGGRRDLAELSSERLSNNGADRLAFRPGALFEIGDQAIVERDGSTHGSQSIAHTSSMQPPT